MNDTIVFYDIYDVWYKPFWKEWWFVATVVRCGSIIILTLSGYYIYTRMKKKYVRSPWEEAIYQLHMLKKNIHLDPDIWYTRLTQIFKEYLVRRYNVHVLSKTDMEIVEYIKDADIALQVRNYLERMFRTANNVRFVKFAIPRITMTHDVDEGLHIVHMTIPQKKAAS